ncbi:MAG: host-nuclease inhibitor protein Gam [Clostridia bacterium]|nr:host-nuclease inhibitor protein Gam [Clostridia bacterium]
MARTKIPETEQLRSWDDANNALMQIAGAEIEIAKIEGDMNIRINEVKEQAERACLPFKAQIAELGKQLKAFAELNRPDFGKTKTRTLTFGDLGFRASTSIQIKTALAEKIIDNLRKLDMSDCIKVTEAINKEVLKTYPADRIIASGATLKKDDTFWYETKKQSLAAEKE